MDDAKAPTYLPPESDLLSASVLDKGFHSRLSFERKWYDVIADFLTNAFGSVTFFICNALFFAFWISSNEGWFAVRSFDPYPYQFLTMIVSLEAIFLAIIVLISQNRQSRIADIRQQMDFEIDVRAEKEITKILHIVDEIRRASGVHLPDPELEQMKLSTDIRELQKAAERNGQ